MERNFIELSDFYIKITVIKYFIYLLISIIIKIDLFNNNSIWISVRFSRFDADGY